MPGGPQSLGTNVVEGRAAMIKEYMSMRKDIWSPLAARIEEEWSVVEEKVGLLFYSIFLRKIHLPDVYLLFMHLYISLYSVGEVYSVADIASI